MSDQAKNNLVYLGTDGLPSSAAISQAGWSSAIIPDFPQRDLISIICQSAGSSNVSAIVMNGADEEFCGEIPPDESTVMKFLVHFSYASVLLSADKALHLFKDASSRFSVLFGERALVKLSFNEDADASNARFVDWLKSADFNAAEESSLMQKFLRYRATPAKGGEGI